MFNRASAKLQDARTAFRGMMDAEDFQTIRSQFHAFLAAINAVPAALRTDGTRDGRPGFRRWHDQELKRIEADELLSFLKNAREENLHEGEPQLRAHSDFVIIRHIDPEEIGPPPVPGAIFEVDHEGAYWRIYQGTPQEERVPVRRGAKIIVQITVTNAPATHLGQPLESAYPAEICLKAIRYYEDLIAKAKQKSWN